MLNASYQPLCVVPVRRALVLALKEKADVVHTNGKIFHSESLEIHAPSVVRLNYFVKVPYRSRASLSRRAVFVRDNFECQYCGRPAENVDHVIPKPGRRPHVGQRRGRLPALQLPQGEPEPRRRRACASSTPPPAPRQRVDRGGGRPRRPPGSNTSASPTPCTRS